MVRKILPSWLFSRSCFAFSLTGIYGMLLFSGKFDTILQDRVRIFTNSLEFEHHSLFCLLTKAPDAHFDSLGGSMLALFQLFVGTRWQQVMCTVPIRIVF